MKSRFILWLRMKRYKNVILLLRKAYVQNLPQEGLFDGAGYSVVMLRDFAMPDSSIIT